MRLLKRFLDSDADSVRGKFYLLLLDKIVIGAILAIAFLVYDRYRAAETKQIEVNRIAANQRFEREMVSLADKLERERASEAQDRIEQVAKVQREFEKAKLLAGILPQIMDERLDVVSRAYLLRSLVSTESLDDSTAIDLLPALLQQGLPDDDFQRIAGPSLHGAIDRVAARGNRLLADWTKNGSHPAWVPSDLPPSNPPDDQRPFLREVRLWRSLLLETGKAIDAPESTPEQSRYVFSSQAPGLCFLLQTEDKHEVALRSRMSGTHFRLIHALLVVCDLNSTSEEKGRASAYVGMSLELPFETLSEIEYARTVIQVLQTFGTKYDKRRSVFTTEIHKTMSEYIAKILVTDFRSFDRGQLFFLRFDAGELLTRMGDRVEAAVPQLLTFVAQFCDAANKARDKASIEELSTEWESGKLLRLAVESLGAIRSDESRAALVSLIRLDEDTLRAFPFLKNTVELALKKRK